MVILPRQARDRHGESSTQKKTAVVSSSSALGSSASGLWESSEMSIDTLVTTDGSTDRVLDETELLEKHLAMEKAARKQARKRIFCAILY